MSLRYAELNLQYYPDPTQGRPVFNGSVYFGNVGTDPEIEANRKNLTLIEEDGTQVPILPAAQPLLTGPGGVIIYNGSPVQVVIDGQYSIKVLNQSGSQVYYVPDSFEFINDASEIPYTPDPGTTTNVQSALRALDVENFAALILISGADAQKAFVNGYYESGDGGGGEFYWDDASVETANNITIWQAAGVPTGRWKRVYGHELNIRWSGVKESETPAFNTPFFQNMIDLACNESLTIKNTFTKFKSGLVTTPNSTTLRVIGDAAGFKALTGKKVSEIEFTGTPAVIEYMITTGTHAHLNIIGNIFSTSDNTEQWGICKVATLGSGNTDQNSADGNFFINFNTFYDVGGTCLSLGGETYGEYIGNVNVRIAQALAINGEGEPVINRNTFENIINAGFSPEASNADACVFIRGTNTRITDNVLADSNDIRDGFYFENCGGISFDRNKLEYPGVTGPAKDVIKVTNTSTPCKFMSINRNSFVRSSTVAGTFVGRIIRTEGTAGAIHNLSLRDNEFAYGNTTGTTISAVDLTANPPRKLSISNNFRETSDNPMIHYPDGFVSVSDKSTWLGGIYGEDVQYITVTSRDFTILAGQTGAAANFNYRLFAAYFVDNITQILPVSFTVTAETDPLDTVTFYLEQDTAKADALIMNSATLNFTNQKRFALRTNYIRTPDYNTPTSFRFFYDSGASASATIGYSVAFTFAVIADPESTLGGKHIIDVI